MQPGILTSLERFSNWIARILEAGERKNWSLNDFMDQHDVRTLLISYRDMIPHVTALKTELPQLNKLIDEYISNEPKLIESSKENGLIGRLLEGFGQLLFIRSRGVDDLMKMLRQVKNNIENISYQVKINED